MRLAYALALRRVGQDDTAQAQLADLLRDGWDAAVIDAFGRHAGSDAERQLTLAEGWLKAHANDAGLLLALGRLAGRARFWAKARTYFESSLQLAPTPVGHLELAQLLDDLGDQNAAAEHYRAGLRLALAPATASTPSLALTGSAPAADDRQHLLPYEA